MTRLLGIDPGSQVTGYGIIDSDGRRLQHVASGCIRPGRGELAERLGAIFQSLRELIRTHRPDEMAVEQVFVNRNVDSALKLGQARGAALVAGVTEGLPLYEYTPAQIKQATVGSGRAEKAQVQHMVRVLLGLQQVLAADAADALAVAICHGHQRATLGRMPGVRGVRGGRFV